MVGIEDGRPTTPAASTSSAMRDAVRGVAERIATRAARIERDRLPRMNGDDDARAAFWETQRARIVEDCVPVVDMARRLRGIPAKDPARAFVDKWIRSGLVEVDGPPEPDDAWAADRADAIAGVLCDMIESDEGVTR